MALLPRLPTHAAHASRREAARHTDAPTQPSDNIGKCRGAEVRPVRAPNFAPYFPTIKETLLP
ncbi:hypothetical protein [Paraburkholderia sacchari]|uniref:hypothetical protein n=1 Tax=Paraburkholderia sacchari TaxID=159450 RepID=UPI003D9810ED